MKTQQTWNAKPDEVERKWWIVDASGKTLGRLAVEIAKTIRGKNKATFTPNVDVGDFVIVVNSEKVNLTGKKLIQKKYYRHSRFFGGLKAFSAEEMLKRDPTYVVSEAVKGMLPKTKLGRQLLTKLKAYKGAEHPHAPQKPEALNVQ